MSAESTSLTTASPRTIAPRRRTGAVSAAAPRSATRGVTPRAVLLGLLFAVFFCAVTPYNDFKVASTYISGTQFPVGALFVLFFFAAGVNGVLRRFAPAHAFRPAELLTMWTLMLVASGLPSSGMMRYLIPNIAAPQSLSNATNDWQAKVWGTAPSWLRLSDPAAAAAFQSGYPRGQEHVPWGAWAIPLCSWGILAALFVIATFCFSNLLRRQWMENERFAFPLVALPVLLAEEPREGRAVSDLLRSRLFWGAFLLVTVYHTQRGLHLLYPSIPDLPQTIPLNPYFTVPPWNHVGSLYLALYPMVVGLAYLLPSDVGLSLWFFHLFYKVELIVAGLYNYDTSGGMISYEYHLFQGLEAFGGGLALVLWVGWTGRRHFRDVWEKATGGARAAEIDDSGEMFSYRATVFGLVISYGGILLWLRAAGIPILFGVCGLLMLTLALTVVSWLVSQAGMLFAQQPYGTLEVLAPTLGTAGLPITPLYTLTQFEFSFLYDTREMLAPSVLMGAKADEAAEQGRELRALFRAMVLSVFLGVLVSGAVSVAMPYLYGGGDGLNNPFMYRYAPTRSLRFLAGAASVPYKGTWTNFLHIVAGFAGVLLLLVARARFGFGLHPIGFLVASVYATDVLWSSIFLGWALKSILQRYTGMRGFQAGLPFFLGLILGDAVNSMVWIALGYATGVGYQITPN